MNEFESVPPKSRHFTKQKLGTELKFSMNIRTLESFFYVKVFRFAFICQKGSWQDSHPEILKYRSIHLAKIQISFQCFFVIQN